MLASRPIALILMLVLLSPGWFGSSAVATAHQPARCAQLAWYAGEMLAAGEQIDADEANGPDMDHVETWTEADFDHVLASYDRILVMVQGIEPPAMAAEFHRVFLEGIELFRDMLETMKTSGVFAMLAYLEPVAKLDQQLAELSLPLETQCGVALFDHDQDGELEVGAGDGAPGAGWSEFPASPIAEPASGSSVPIGTTVQTSDAFSLTIVSVDQDARDAVAGSVPPDGFRYVNVEIKLGHVREETDRFELENLVALGPTGVAYSAVNNSCGPVNGPLAPGEYGGTLTMTGHVCFVVASQDVTGLRLYDASQPVAERVYLSLDPSVAHVVGASR